MGFLDKAKKAVVDHADQIDGAVDRAANLADKRTKGKHTSKIDKASGKARDLLRGLDNGPGKGGGRGPAAGDDVPPRL
jgi:hypothetical protein